MLPDSGSNALLTSCDDSVSVEIPLQERLPSNELSRSPTFVVRSTHDAGKIDLQPLSVEELDTLPPLPSQDNNNNSGNTTKKPASSRTRKVITVDMNQLFNSSGLSMSVNEGDKTGHFSHMTQKICQTTEEFFRRFLKLILFFAYNVYLIFAIMKTWNQV